MRNLTFIFALGAAIVGGVAIGSVVDLGGLTGIVLRPGEGAAPGEQAQDGAPREFYAFGRRAPDRLDFSIDTTRSEGGEGGSGGSSYRPDRSQEITTCRLPTATPDQQLILFGAYEGDAISSVALADPDVETGVMDVVIEPGRKPLYIILTSYSSTIWRFSGAVDRVSQVVLMASPTHPPALIADPSPPRHTTAFAAAQPRTRSDRRGRGVYAGVTGLAQDRVKTVQPEGCFSYFYQIDSIATARLIPVVRRAAGRRPDVVAGSYSLAAIRFPSGRGARVARDDSPPPPPGFDAGLWREAIHFSPAGLAEIDPADVVSAVPARRYDVLPSQMGLSQLVGSGHLQPLSDGVKIVRPIPRFPAALTGAHSTAFLLGRGVPMPAGDPGHSCVIREDTGEPASPSPLCR